MNIKLNATAIVTLDTLNCGSIIVRDRDDISRFTITINNNVNQRSLSVDVSAWDKDNYGTPAEKAKDVVVSFNHREDRDA